MGAMARNAEGLPVARVIPQFGMVPPRLDVVSIEVDTYRSARLARVPVSLKHRIAPVGILNLRHIAVALRAVGASLPIVVTRTAHGWLGLSPPRLPRTFRPLGMLRGFFQVLASGVGEGVARSLVTCPATVFLSPISYRRTAAGADEAVRAGHLRLHFRKERCTTSAALLGEPRQVWMAALSAVRRCVFASTGTVLDAPRFGLGSPAEEGRPAVEAGILNTHRRVLSVVPRPRPSYPRREGSCCLHYSREQAGKVG